jgi:hypothetical protein
VICPEIAAALSDIEAPSGPPPGGAFLYSRVPAHLVIAGRWSAKVVVARLDRAIQYAAAPRFHHRRLWDTGSPAFAGDDD